MYCFILFQLSDHAKVQNNILYACTPARNFSKNVKMLCEKSILQHLAQLTPAQKTHSATSEARITISFSRKRNAKPFCFPCETNCFHRRNKLFHPRNKSTPKHSSEITAQRFT